MSPDHITTGAYNRDIDKRLARKLVCATRDYTSPWWYVERWSLLRGEMIVCLLVRAVRKNANQ